MCPECWAPVEVVYDDEALRRWTRADVEAEIDKCTCEVAGSQAQAMKHGLAIHTPHGPLFVETASA